MKLSTALWQASRTTPKNQKRNFAGIIYKSQKQALSARRKAVVSNALVALDKYSVFAIEYAVYGEVAIMCDSLESITKAALTELEK